MFTEIFDILIVFKDFWKYIEKGILRMFGNEFCG